MIPPWKVNKNKQISVTPKYHPVAPWAIKILSKMPMPSTTLTTLKKQIKEKKDKINKKNKILSFIL